MNGEDRAVVVGITRYPSLSSLGGPENDAHAFRSWLVDPEGGGLPEKNVATVMSSDFEAPDDPTAAEPTVERVRQCFDRLIVEADERRGRIGRRLYIYMAGHGVAPEVDDAALLMANAGLRRLIYLPGARIAAYFRTAPIFDEVVLFMDCCRDHSGRLPAFALPWLDMAERGHDARFVYGFATKWSAKAREKPMDDGKVCGVFTRAVIEALGQGSVTTTSLKRYVHARLPQLADRDEYQRPVFLHSDEEIEFRGAAAGPAAALRIKLKRPYRAVSVTVKDGSHVTLATEKPGAKRWEVPLAPGLYAIRRSDSDQDALISLVSGSLDVDV